MMARAMRNANRKDLQQLKRLLETPEPVRVTHLAAPSR
jgi:hypothetical protein